MDQFREQKTQEIQKIVDAQISKMRRLITVTADDDPQKPDFMFRLGELYAEKLRRSGVDVETTRIAGAAHGFFSGTDETATCVQQLVAAALGRAFGGAEA